MTRRLARMFALTAMLTAMAAPAGAGEIYMDVPETVDPDARYLIYLHGGRPESFPMSEPHQRFGLFEYDAIVTGLAGSGFEVISELRLERTNPRRYVRTRVLPQVTALMEAGVPAHRITVAGFSKGGNMSLIVAALAKQPSLNIVNMAGCGAGRFRKSYDNFLNVDAPKMQGRMLSMYDREDTIAGTCKEAADKAPRLKFEEEVLEVGDGHGTFYGANPVWIDRIAAWADAAPATN